MGGDSAAVLASPCRVNPLVGWHGLFSRASPARATRSWPHQCLTLPKAAASPEPNAERVGMGGTAAEVSGEAESAALDALRPSLTYPQAAKDIADAERECTDDIQIM